MEFTQHDQRYSLNHQCGEGRQAEGNRQTGIFDQKAQDKEEASECEHAVEQAAQDMRRSGGTVVTVRENGEDRHVQWDRRQ